MTPMILGGLQENMATRTTSFEMVVSSPSPGSVGRIVGHYSHCSKTHSGTRAHMKAFVDSSLVIALLHGEHVAGLGPQNYSPSSRHGAGKRANVDRCSCICP
jgi:hypothetical protein